MLHSYDLIRCIAPTAQVVQMHRNNGSAFWLQRPLSSQLLRYAANDIVAIDIIYKYFLQRRWISAQTLPTLLSQSARYVVTQWNQGRADNDNIYRMGVLFPLDILASPAGSLVACSACNRQMSLPCFTQRQMPTHIMRHSKCKLCNILTVCEGRALATKWIRVD